MVLYLIAALATALFLLWLALLFMATGQDLLDARNGKALEIEAAIEKLYAKDVKRREKLAQYHGLPALVMRALLGGGSDKEIAKLQRAGERLMAAKPKGVSVFVLPGYALQSHMSSIGRGALNRTVMTLNFELYGRKNAEARTKQLIAKLLSYPVIGIAASLAVGVALLGMDNRDAGLAVMGVGSALVLVLAYAMYDELNDAVSKRRAAIARQFPNVVSKLALLVTSGMIMDRAWKETAYSQEAEIYREMRRTSEELDNLVSPENAYENFINRCNTKETAKLASAILQNLSKGNAEIGALLTAMAHEAWQERRHTAKRDSEKANSKLMIPTMLLFLAILVMIMVPVAISFTSL